MKNSIEFMADMMDEGVNPEKRWGFVWGILWVAHRLEFEDIKERAREIMKVKEGERKSENELED